MGDFEGILETGSVAAAELAASAAMARNHKPCPNCDAQMTGAYCAQCGQERDTHRRTVWGLIKDYTEDLISFDSRVLRTLRALLFQPGELPLAFREGRTQRYVPAIRLYLFVSLLFFLFLSATGIALMQFSIKMESYKLTHDAQGHVFRTENGKMKPDKGLWADAKGNVYAVESKDAEKVTGPIAIPEMKADGSVNNNISNTPVFFQRIGSVHPNLTPQQRASLASAAKGEQEEIDKQSNNWFEKGIYGATQKLQNNPAALNGPLMTWIPRILFLLLPLYAIVLFLFYVRKRKSFYFVDHLVFSLSVHTAAFAILIVAAIAAQLIDGLWVGAFVFVSLAVYVLLAMKRFDAQRWPITVVKYLAVGFIYSTFLLAPALAAAIIASMIWA
ncbi:MAG: DUF3667 domain-containing protein [Rhizomicrobium sp.]